MGRYIKGLAVWHLTHAGPSWEGQRSACGTWLGPNAEHSDAVAVTHPRCSRKGCREHWSAASLNAPSEVAP